jgi:hypothetical protein
MHIGTAARLLYFSEMATPADGEVPLLSDLHLPASTSQAHVLAAGRSHF